MSRHKGSEHTRPTDHKRSEGPPRCRENTDAIATRGALTEGSPDVNDVDEAFGGENGCEEIVAPNNIERLEEIRAARNLQRKLEEEK